MNKSNWKQIRAFVSDTPICFLRRGRRTSCQSPLIRFLSHTGLVTVGRDLERTAYCFRSRLQTGEKHFITVDTLKIRTNSDESHYMCNNQSVGRGWGGWLWYFGSYSVILSRLNVTTNMLRSFHSQIVFPGSMVLSGTSASCLKLVISLRWRTPFLNLC